MYSSPFPKLNPNVRYKTVLERAGFDVIYDTNKKKDNGILRTSKSTPNLRSKNKKKFEFSNKNFTNDHIPYNTDKYRNDKDIVITNGINSLGSSNDIDSDSANNPNINTSHDDSLFDFENNKYKTDIKSNKNNRDNKDNKYISGNDSCSNELNDTRNTSDLGNEISNLKINFSINSKQAFGGNPNVNASSKIELEKDLQNQFSKQNDLIIDDINSRLSNIQNGGGVVEKKQKNDNDDNGADADISYSTSIYVSSANNIEIDYIKDEKSIDENSLNNDMSNISETRPLSLININKSSEESQAVKPLHPAIQNTKSNKINELIDQLNNSALPKENELNLISGVTSFFSSSSSPGLLVANNNISNTERPKKSSYYLSGLPINNIEEIREAIKPITTTTTMTPTTVSPLKVEYKTGEGPCRLCHREITFNARFAKELTGQWHRDCFQCIKCNQKFNKSNPCYILNDEPYCQMDYHIVNNTICKICGIFIEGECLENDKEERFHVRCLTCFLCHEVIKNDYFLCNDNIPVCDKHDINQLMSDGETENKLGNNEEQESLSATNINTTMVEKRRTRLLNL